MIRWDAPFVEAFDDELPWKAPLRLVKSSLTQGVESPIALFKEAV